MEGIEHNKQYSLRWEKHAFNLASEAGGFFEDESFLDCTLSAEGQCIDAHKIILSASSSYLSKLLKITPDKHPILIFNDIKFDQLKSLVAFIYNGSVSVSEDNIHAFLKAAQSLLIKGLSEETKDDQIIENEKKPLIPPESRGHQKKSTSGKINPRKSEIHSDGGKPYYNNYHPHKKQRQTAAVTKSDGECEESLSKLQDISFTKYIHKNLNSKSQDSMQNEIVDNKWNGPLMEEKLRIPAFENYVVKSWKHNSVEDLNGRHRQNHKNNFLKKIKVEKPSGSSNASNIDNIERGNGNRDSGHQTDYSKLDEIDDRIKKEADTEPIMLVEPKQEMTEEEEEEEDANLEDYDNVQNASNESLSSDTDPNYDVRSMSNYYQAPVVDRGVPVPLLMCRTSLSEPDSIEPNWMPQIAGNGKSDQSISMNVGKTSDLPCRTCTQNLPCPTCTKKYKSRYALNRHILYECGKARKSFSCDECGKKVTRQDTLQKHKLIHLVQHLKKKESEVDDELPKTRKMC